MSTRSIASGGMLRISPKPEIRRPLTSTTGPPSAQPLAGDDDRLAFLAFALGELVLGLVGLRRGLGVGGGLGRGRRLVGRRLAGGGEEDDEKLAGSHACWPFGFVFIRLRPAGGGLLNSSCIVGLHKPRGRGKSVGDADRPVRSRRRPPAARLRAAAALPGLRRDHRRSPPLLPVLLERAQLPRRSLLRALRPA